MKIAVGGFEFDFTDALDAFVFDDATHGLSHAMKAVDLVVELEENYLFVEVKDFESPDEYAPESVTDETGSADQRKSLNHLKQRLKYKFRDSYLYRLAERRIDKPVRYLCLLTLENALLSVLNKELKADLPVGRAGPRWHDELARSCTVLNLERWNRNFPKWPVKRLAGGGT